MNKVVLMCVCGLWIGVSPVMAQFGPGTTVIDPSNLAQNVAQVGYSLQLVQLALKNLAPLQEIGQALQIATDLQRLMTQAEGIAGRIGSRQGLWQTIGPMPTTARAFREMQRTHEALCLTVDQDALGATSLVAQIPAMLTNLTQLISHLQGMLGNLAALQAANSILASVSGQLSMLTLGTAALGESTLCERWAGKVQRRALDEVSGVLTRDYGQIESPQ